MGLLLFLVGLLALVSGALQLRPRMREALGTPPLALAEVVAGVLVVLGSAAGLSRTPVAPWAVAITLSLVVLAVVSQARRAARWRRSREISEAERLQSYVEFRAGKGES
jgi:hypothetical protein